MLTSLKDYLQRVDSKTLCIEQHLYENITSIQYSCLYNNTIPEAHCFAFDFIQNNGRGHKDALSDHGEGKWDLIYTSDTKHFSSETNQRTHDAIRDRFLENALPQWVVKGDLSLSARSQKVDSIDRNNTT